MSPHVVRRAIGRRRAGELALVTLGSLLLGAIAFGPYVGRGGFIYDDWQRQAITRFHGFGGEFNALIETTPRRPLGAAYLAAVHTVLGGHEHLHLALAAGLRVLVSLVLFAVLREIGLDRVTAGAAGALALLFPWSDATALWATGAQLSLSTTCWLLGLLVALRGLRAPARGRAWHALAVLLYVASILLYEDTLIVVVLGGALYLGRAPRRVALWRWAADVASAALVVLFFTSRWIHLAGGADIHKVQDLHGTLHHVGTIADQGITLAAQSLLPFGAPGRWAVVAGALLLTAVASGVAWRTPDASLRRELLAWLCAAAGGLVVVLAGWAMLAPADPYYSPGVLGVGNRINVVAGLGLVLLAVALVRMAATLAFSAVPADRRRASAVVTVLVAAAIGGAYLDRLGADRGDWWRARRAEGFVLGRLGLSIARPPAGSTVIARGFPLYQAPGVPVFAARWDLDGAVKLLWKDPSLVAWPSPPGGLLCGAGGVAVADVAANPPARYGRTLLVDLARGTAVPIDSPQRCRGLARAG